MKRLLSLLLVVLAVLAVVTSREVSHEPTDVVERHRNEAPNALALGLDASRIEGGEETERVQLSPTTSTTAAATEGRRLIRVVAKASSAPVVAVLNCATCGAHGSTGSDGFGSLDHLTSKGGGPHMVEARSPLFLRSLVAINVLAQESSSVEVIELEEALKTTVEVLADDAATIDYDEIRWSQARNLTGRDRAVPSVTAYHALGAWSADPSPQPAFSRVLLDVGATDLFSLHLPGFAPPIGPLQPGQGATIDLRTGSTQLILRTPGGQPRPGQQVLAIERGGTARFYPLVANDEGKCSCSASYRTWLELHLAATEPASFAQAQPHDAVIYREPLRVLLPSAPTTTPEIYIDDARWLFQLIDSSSGAPVDGAFLATLDYQASGIGWMELTRHDSDGNLDGVFGFRRTYRLSASRATRLMIQADGFQTLTMILSREPILSDLQTVGDPLPLLLELAQSEFRLDLGGAAQALAQGELLMIPTDDHESTPSPRIRVGTGGYSEVFTVPPGSYNVLTAPRTEPVGSVDVPRHEPGLGVRDLVLEIADAGLSAIVCADVPATFDGVLYVRGRNGQTWPMTRVDSGLLRAEVVPGGYVVGPLPWVLNESHRLRDRRFGVQVSGDSVEPTQVEWNNRWSAMETVETVITTKNVRSNNLYVIPIYEESRLSFVCDEAQVKTRLTNSPIVTRDGDPQPTGYALCARVSGTQSESLTPVAFVPHGGNLSVSFEYVSISAKNMPGLDSSGNMLLEIMLPSMPAYLAYDVSKAPLPYPGDYTLSVGPLEPRFNRITVGGGPSRTEIYPTVSDLLKIEVE